MPDHGLKYSGQVPKKVRDEINRQIPANVKPSLKRRIQIHLLIEKGYMTRRRR